MNFELSITINRSPEEVFTFLRDKDQYPQGEGSPIKLIEKITPGPIGVGTSYREIVQITHFTQVEIHSEITYYKPPEALEEDFWASGMDGHLAYQFIPVEYGTRIIQREILYLKGFFKVLASLIR